MTYEQYLFSNIWKLRDENFNSLEYDLQYSLVFDKYEDFLNSDFSKLNRGLYECILLYFDNN